MGPPGPSPGSATDVVSKSIHLLYFIAVTNVDLHCGFVVVVVVFSCLRDGVVGPLLTLLL